MNNIAAIFALVLLVASCSQQSAKSSSDKVFVHIDYGVYDEILEAELSFAENMTAMEALQRVVNVETVPVGEYVFVRKIDTIVNRKDENAWYYKINDVSAKVLAIDYVLQPGDTMQWINKSLMKE